MNQKSLSDFQSSGVECPTCGRDDFAKEAYMKIHHAEAHGESISGVETSCDYCGESFRRTTAQIDVTEKTFCSRDCFHTWRKETGSIAGENNPLYKQSTTLVCEVCGEDYQPRIGTEDNSRYCSPECKHEGLSRRTGKDHPLFQGGYDYYVAIRRGVSERGWHSTRNEHLEDSCELCGTEESPGGRGLSLHHVVPVLAGGTNGEYNFMTLCEPCHSRVESYCSDLPGFDRILAE